MRGTPIYTQAKPNMQ